MASLRVRGTSGFLMSMSYCQDTYSLAFKLPCFLMTWLQKVPSFTSASFYLVIRKFPRLSTWRVGDTALTCWWSVCQSIWGHVKILTVYVIHFKPFHKRDINLAVTECPIFFFKPSSFQNSIHKIWRKLLLLMSKLFSFYCPQFSHH